MNLLLVFLLGLGGARPGYSDGDDLFVKREYPNAIAVYRASLGNSTDSSGVLWRLARVYVCLGDISSGAEADSLYSMAAEASRLAVKIDSGSSAGHAWLAAALGSTAMKEGARTKVRLCREIYAELTIALRCNPNDDIALSILGSFYRALGDVSWIERQLANLFLGGLPKGGYQEAEESLLHAVQVSPEVIRHHYELGMVYRATDRRDEACAEFKKVLALPPLLASDDKRKREARQFLEQFEER